METKQQPELALLLLDSEGSERQRRLKLALSLSIAAHVIGIVLVRYAPAIDVHREVKNVEIVRTVTPLVMPPSLVTQRSPNQGKLSKDITLEALQAPRTPVNAAAPGVPSPPGPKQNFKPPVSRPGVSTPNQSLPDAPPVEVAQNRPQGAPNPLLGTPNAAAPPKIEPQEKPKLAFETPGSVSGSLSGQGRVKIPQAQRSTVDEIVRTAPKGPQAGLSVGDEGTAGAGPDLRSPLPGKLGSQVELQSDPMGVDFAPYLIRVLSAVRRNWYAVIPESARFGRQGRTVIQFAISKDGSVPKLVIAGPSGAEALDRAAVAGISASNPFPPLPPEFKGQQIRLQLVFSYNLNR